MILKQKPLPFSLFQIQREEEKMRLIVTLIREVNSKPSYPHLIIWFDEIQGSRLVYSILLVREKSREPIDLTLERVDPTLKFIPERVQQYGNVEVNCFTLKIKVSSECLVDHSIHPTKARQQVLQLFIQGLGPVRDYYGGLLEKKEENLLKLKRHFPEIGEAFIEEFFSAIHPQKMQATLTEEVLRDYFSYTLFCFQKRKRHFFWFDRGFFAYCQSDELDLLPSLKMEFYRKEIDLHSMISVSLVRNSEAHISLLIPFF